MIFVIYILAGGIVVGLLLTLIITKLLHFLHRREQTKADKPKQSKPSAAKVLAGDLQNEKAKSDVVLQSIDDGVILIDKANTIQVFNKAAENITGWPIAEATKLTVNNVIELINEKGEAYPEERNAFLRAVTATETIRDNNACLKSRSGKIVPINLSVTPLYDANSKLQGTVAVFRDVTQERGEEKQRAEFISTASHEMRTPVAAIEGYLALALNDKVSKVDAKAREYLEKAHESTQHLGKLFQDLLTAAKSEDGRLINHQTVIEMGGFLEQLVEGMRFTAEKKGLAVKFVLGAVNQTVDASGSGNKVVKPLYHVYADQDRIREVFTNLFDNAIKYSEQGTITFGLTGNTDVVQIRVSDTGAGIPAEDIPHLFQKFYRVDSSFTRAVGGTGLGLFISRKIIELYQGRIWVDSKLGQGSTFYINLPRISNERATTLRAQEASQLQPIATATTL